ncbi:MAG: DUF3833 domain-containing protein [Desulfuromonadales bacterium]|nr:DUF3833 domain-containing protein [Desulfuromonadales bacterium]MBN2793363.1 DUF3833 domain-containing protein [Desulfuromonadales bacterium]
MKKILHLCLFIPLSLFFFGCSSVTVHQYAENRPHFDLYEFFSGQVKGWGIVQSRNGTLLRQFVVDIDGQVNAAGELVLTEDFIWSDGELSQRIWTISGDDTQSFSGRADDVIGEARGEAAGNTLNWGYTLNLDVDGRTWKIAFDDWMFLQPDNVLINRATMKKFGFRVGEITIAFIKQ